MQEDNFVLEKRDIDFAQDYCKPEPQYLTIKGHGLRTDNWEQFQQKLEQKFATSEYGEDFDAFLLKDYMQLKAKHFNYILQEVNRRLKGRELLIFAMEGCRFSQQDDSGELIDTDLLHAVCSKVFRFSLVNCRMQQQT